MRRRAPLVLVLSATLLLVLGYCQPVAAMQDGTTDSAMTASVARIVWNGVYQGHSGSELCTGSVVGDGWVLTALHCLFPQGIANPPLDWHGFRVQLWKAGVTSIATPDYSSALSGKPTWMNGGDSKNDGQVLYRDVMLLHVASPMPGWAKTIPMALAWPALGTTLTEYGYGDLNDSKNAPAATTLQKSRQGSIARAACPSGYAWSNGDLCTSTSSSIPWEGDSGGPLLWWINGYWQQVGSFSQFLPSQTWRSFWSEADGDTRNWVLSTVGATAPVGAILRDEASGASWLYEADGYRHWIPDGGTYNCLVNNGATVLNRPLRTVEALPDKVGNWATCTPAPPKPAPTWTEQEGSHGANSFANPHNASGMGPHLAAMAYVQVSCKVYAPEIASVNPDGYWYRIASAPWNSAYYIAANTFWNGDVPGHLPYTHNTDWNVPNC